MSEILTPNDFDVSILSWVEDGAMRQAGKRHDAALRAENARLREAIKEWVPALRKACVRVLPDEAQPWTWLALLGEARNAADALDEALAAEREEKEENRG